MEETAQKNLMESMKPVAESSEKFEVIKLDDCHMMQTKIAEVKIVESDSGYVDGKFVEKLPQPRKQLYVASEILKSKKLATGEVLEFRAREWFNVLSLKDGSLGWSMNTKGKLNNFLKAMKVVAPKDLVGKSAIVKVVDKKEDDGSTTQNLRFMY